MRTARWSIVGALIWVGACGDEGSPLGPAEPGAPSLPSADAGGGLPGDAALLSDGSAVSEGLPCEVSALLSRYCSSCHGAVLAAGVPMPLQSIGDLQRAAMFDANETVAEASLRRMRSADNPMPPSGSMPTDTEIAAFENWLDEGMPRGSCGDVLDPFAVEPSCTTDSYWLGGNRESPLMNPGEACNDCHTRGVGGEHGPSLSVAGTVFATGHEPDDCNGANGRLERVVVEITDGSGRKVQLGVNEAGNFFYEDRLTPPLTARIKYQGRVREMLTAQTSGDCNACHSETGAEGAPGRIVLP